MAKKISLADQIGGIRKGRKIKVKANRNVASVTAHRKLGEGNYSVTAIGTQYSEVRHLA